MYTSTWIVSILFSATIKTNVVIAERILGECLTLNDINVAILPPLQRQLRWSSYIGIFDLSLTLGRPLCSVSFSYLYHNTDGWLQLITRRLPFIYKPSPEIHRSVRGTESRSQVIITFSVFYGQNLSSAPGQAELLTQYFLWIWVTTSMPLHCMDKECQRKQSKLPIWYRSNLCKPTVIWRDAL